MKKIFGLLGFVLGLLVFAACGSDDIDNPYAKVSSISVDSASVLFQAAPGTGVVTVTAPNGITKVVSEQPWCTTTVNGNVVTVQVEGNSDMLGRSSLLTIYSGEDYAQVTVQQMGFIFALDASSIVSGDDAATLSYGMNANADVAVSTSADWITASLGNGTLEVKLTANTTGHIRKGYVYYEAGALKDSVSVTQYDFDKDIAGNYRLLYRETENATELYYLNAVVSRDSISLPDLGLRLPASFDESGISINFQCGQYCGQYGSYYVYTAFSLGGGYWTAYYTTTTAWGVFDYDNEAGYQYCAIDQSTSSRGFTGFTLRACSEQNFSADTELGALIDLYSPLLQKVDGAGGAKEALKAPALKRGK
ncbi:BACON domain-containing protein [Prevotella sp. KH2C16]|uniref:BACON domain-containing protein n=1 Tax=Prevotella sp. KH2C16 TaxID=1855325 RepID=UPI0008E2C5D6|nr:BACON domain-containing protein [Prevotella sp. KH2C16]SFG04155.1 Putative binding domain-containing protein, N-terminal [Prevotella sp. KH2C16]